MHAGLEWLTVPKGWCTGARHEATLYFPDDPEGLTKILSMEGEDNKGQKYANLVQQNR